MSIRNPKSYLTVLINGDLVVRNYPRKTPNPIGQFLIYRIVDDQAYFWKVEEDRIKAVWIGHRVGGHTIQIRTIEC